MWCWADFHAGAFRLLDQIYITYQQCEDRTRVPNTHCRAFTGAMTGTKSKAQRELCPFGLVPFIPISCNPFI